MSTKTLTTAVTGRAGREGADEAFATIIAGGGNAQSTGCLMRLQAQGTGPRWQALRRGFLVFNPLSFPLPAGFIVSGAVLKLTPSVIPTDTFVQSICIGNAVMGSPLVGTVNADYQGTASSRTEYANRVAIAAMTVGVVSNFTFNATGVSYLSTQYTAGDPIVLGVRWSCDIDQTDPGASLATEDINLLGSAAQLVVTYRIGPGHAIASLTGTLDNGADTVTCSMWTIEVFT